MHARFHAASSSFLSSKADLRSRRRFAFPLLLLAVLLGFAGHTARAEKIWTTNASGFWSDGQNWSGHTPPDITSFIQITNDVTKTVTLDAATPAATLTVQKLTLSAPPGVTNTVLLSNLGDANPLVFQTGLELLDGAAIRITNSVLQTLLTNDHVNLDGSVTLDSGLIDFGDVTVTARVGRVTAGIFTINGGTVSAGAMTVGGLTNSSGNLIMNGGVLNVASFFSAGRNLSTTGTVSVLGGQINVPNDDTRIGDDGVGQMVVSNATLALNNLQVARDTSGSLFLYSGGNIQVALDTVIGRFAGATGLVSIAGGQLLSSGQKLFVGRGGVGQLNLSSGTVQNANVLIAADGTNSVGALGTVVMTGGNLLISSNLLVGSAGNATGQVFVTGGAVSVTNSGGSGALVLSSGQLNLNGGLLTADNLLLTNTSGQLILSSGTLSTKRTVVANGSPFVIGDGTSSATLHLDGGAHSFANGLVIMSNATLSGCGTLIGSIVNHGTISTNCGAGITGPTIRSAPQNEVVVLGSPASFSVVAEGTQPMAYQWQFNGSPVPGATTSTYSLSNAQLIAAGTYSVVVSNQAGSVTSPPATLTILIPPSISVPPQSQSIIQGSNITFTVTAAGSAPLAYQWLFGSAGIAGATTSAFSRTNVQPADAGAYSVIVSNQAGSMTSASATLTILVPPSISVPPQSQTVIQGSNITFTVTAAGSAPLAYQWRFDGADIAGATTSAFSRTNIQPADAGAYSVIVTNQAGSITSASASLTVVSSPTSVTVSLQSSAGAYTISFNSAVGSIYTLQFQDLLSDPSWTDLPPSTNGTGKEILLRDTTAGGLSRFYRLHVQ